VEFEVKASSERDFQTDEINEQPSAVKPNMFTEEEFQIIGSSSPFQYKNTRLKYIVQEGNESDINKYYCETIQRLFM
jgi:hypothetical protein